MHIFRYRVKLIIKICNIHGKLTADQAKVESNRWRCKKCHAKSSRLYREKNREKLRLYARRYREINKK